MQIFNIKEAAKKGKLILARKTIFPFFLHQHPRARGRKFIWERFRRFSHKIMHMGENLFKFVLKNKKMGFDISVSIVT